MLPHIRERARQAGEDWAERKAELLLETLPARVWPDAWYPESDELPRWVRALPEEERALALEEADLAAASRWIDLLTERRALEDVEDEELDGEATARQLAARIRPDVPARLTVHCDGPRVYLLDEETGDELTVHSLSDAWRVLDAWGEHPR